MTPVRLEPVVPRSGVKHSTTEPLFSLYLVIMQYLPSLFKLCQRVQKKKTASGHICYISLFWDSIKSSYLESLNIW